MKVLAVVLSLSLVMGCAHISGLSEKEDKELAKQKQDLEIVQMAETLLTQKQYGEALVAFQKFITENPNSIYNFQAKLGEAEVLHQLGQSQEALTNLQKLRDAALARTPRAAALASYQMSLIYEDLGELERTLAGLSDAEAQKEYLSPIIVHAQIPARKAMIYARMGSLDLASYWVLQADRGVEYLRATIKSSNTDWLVEAYYNMGKISSQSQLGMSLDGKIEVYRLAYPYLYKAIARQKDPWSKLAQEALLGIYRDLSMQVDKTVHGGSIDKRQASRVSVEIQRAMLFRPLDISKTDNTLLRSLFEVEDSILKKLDSQIFSGVSDMPLTPESEERSTIKRGYRLVTPEVEQVPALGEDPNL